MRDNVLYIDNSAIPQAENRFFRQTDICNGCDCFLGDGDVAEGYIKQIEFPGKYLVECMNYCFRCFVAKRFHLTPAFIELLCLDSIDYSVHEDEADELCATSGMRVVIAGGKSGELVFSPNIPIRGVRVVVHETFFQDVICNKFHTETSDIFKGDLSNPALRLVFSQIKQSMESGITSEMYYTGKILELLFLTTSHARTIEAQHINLRALSDDDVIAVNAAKNLIDTRLDKPPLIKELAASTNTSASKLQRDFKTAFGCTLNGYAQQARMEAALQKIENTADPIYRIAESVGCKNPSRFSELFKQTYGLTPSEYRSTIYRVAQ
jgi:AraC-like DNA-binding protein